MVKVIAFREDTWMDAISDYRCWSNLCRSYQVSLQLLESSWDEAIVPEDHKVVILDEVGTHNLNEFVHPENCVYIFGKTRMNNLIENIPHDVSVRVNAPDSKSMFGISVCCAVLYDRLVK